jgi:Cdc6-like AAA superfamily ATPase
MSTWNALGFSASPYNVQPLKVDESHVPLLVGRSDDGVRFCTFIDSAPEGVIVVSGSPGVGKTSFFNIFQYLLESKNAACGPNLLAARSLCPLQVDDSSRTIAQRVLQTILKNVLEYCKAAGRSVPGQSARLLSWIGDKSATSWDFQIVEFADEDHAVRQVRMPSINEATFETFQDAIGIVVSDVVEELKLEGIFVALDNVENLENQRLADLLMSFRDTLFSVPNVWWVIIGQSGLYSLIQALDSRVSERVTGSGLELKPIGIDELSKAVDERVEKFHVRQTGKAPLSHKIHKMLYEASFGEIRFVFKYCNNICMETVARIRKRLMDQKIPINDSVVNQALGELLTEQHVPDNLALDVLKGIVKDELGGLGLKVKDKRLLRDIGSKGSARSREFKEFGFSSSQDFSSNYLSRLESQAMLVRSQEGRASIYKLRGLAILANEFGFLDT